MDRATLLCHRPHWTAEPNPAVRRMEHLVPAEQSVYGDLIEDRYGVAVRLEQERVAFSSLRRALSERGLACRRGDLNPHDLAVTSPSSWRVCLFRHSDVGSDPIAGSCGRDQRRRTTHRAPARRQDWAFGLFGGTRIAQFWVSQSSEGPFAFGETPAVTPDHARRLGSVKSGSATMSCQSAASTCE
jgi:hypothetical protein